MSFWEELSRKITNRSQAAVQKTKNLADIVTMDADISDARIRIRDLEYIEYGSISNTLLMYANRRLSGKVNI